MTKHPKALKMCLKRILGKVLHDYAWSGDSPSLSAVANEMT